MLLIDSLKKSYLAPDGTRLPILDSPRFEVAAGAQVVQLDEINQVAGAAP